MKQYSYSGPVLEFGKCIAQQWTGSTFAPSEAKARCNLTYQFKRQYRKTVNTVISLPGKLTITG